MKSGTTSTGFQKVRRATPKLKPIQFKRVRAPHPMVGESAGERGRLEGARGRPQRLGPGHQEPDHPRGGRTSFIYSLVGAIEGLHGKQHGPDKQHLQWLSRAGIGTLSVWRSSRQEYGVS